jgi:hypothetical protein
MPHHRSTNPQHYPTINKGTTIRPSNLEGMDARQDAAVDAVMPGMDDHPVEAIHRCPNHMSEEHSWSCTFREECSNDLPFLPHWATFCWPFACCIGGNYSTGEGWWRIIPHGIFHTGPLPDVQYFHCNVSGTFGVLLVPVAVYLGSKEERQHLTR